jgi:hypothetical protein
LFGPVIGTIANAVGRGPAFSAVVVLSLGLIVLARGLPLSHAPSGQGLRQLRAALTGRGLWGGMWLVTLPAVVSGTVNVLGPLRLHAFGAAAAAIGATFLAAAGAEALATPMIGRLSDRRGRILPLRGGLIATLLLLVCFTLPRVPALLAALMNLAWAVGAIFGSGVGGAIAKAAGDGPPMFVAAALCALTLAGLARR